MADIRHWLELHGLGKYAQVFAENDVGLDILPDLSDEQLEQMEISLGDRVRLRKALVASPDHLPAALGFTDAPTRGDAEHRQLTVMFCDLVGSVALAEKLDVEDYRDLLSRFRNSLVAAVERHRGFIARHQGDGLLVYFGFPHAHEDDAERAVRAGLAVVDGVEKLDHPYDTIPKVRVGIATGSAVVGDVLATGASDHSELAALGPTPNLAARLQGEADPNTVVVSETTRALTSGHFRLAAMSARTLKGLSDPVTPYRVLSELRGRSRLVARSGSRFSPFVGREAELETLTQRWSQANENRGQVILVSGEAGIGKSRLVQRFQENLAGVPHEPIHVQCSPYHESSAFYPVIAAFERVLVPSGESEAHSRLERLERHFADVDLAGEEACGLMAHLLSLQTGGRFQSIEAMEKRRRREKTLELLVEYLRRRAARAPVLCMFEDLHWVDPSTMELFDRLVDSVVTTPVLLIGTTRPGFAAAWTNQPHTVVLGLERLGSEESERLTQSVASHLSAIPTTLVQGIVTRAGGIPLYIEELTRTVIQSSQTGEIPDAIPATLQDSLMARLDASASGKTVAQCAAVFGRMFDLSLLTEVWEGSPEHLTAGLDSLEQTELIYRQGDSGATCYIFKHALVRDTAYGSLLREHRTKLHQRVARALVQHLPEIEDSQPALLAYHYTRAGDSARALKYWQRAGRAAVRNNAPLEAESNFLSGLEVLKGISNSTETLNTEAELLLDLGGAQMAIYGFTAREVGETYSRAREIAARLGDPEQKFEATWGLWLNRHLGGDPEGARELLAEIDQHAEASGKLGSQLQAHHAAWTTYLVLGDIANAYRHTQRGATIYSVEEHGDHAHRYGGHDPGVCGGAHAGMIGWLLGHIDQAYSGWKAATELAVELDQRTSLGTAYSFGFMMFQFRREPDALLELAENMDAMTPVQRAFARIIRGWAFSRNGQPEDGLRECEDGIEAYRQCGGKIRLGYAKYLTADVYDALGRKAEADGAIESAVEHAHTTGDSWWYPELVRARAVRRMTETMGDQLQIVEELQIALNTARQSQCKSLELRAATTLCRLLWENGHADQARETLEPVYDWFTEGFVTPDLREARGLLDNVIATGVREHRT